MKLTDYGRWYTVWYYIEGGSPLQSILVKANQPVSLEEIEALLPPTWHSHYIDLSINSVWQIASKHHKRLELRVWKYNDSITLIRNSP